MYFCCTHIHTISLGPRCFFSTVASQVTCNTAIMFGRCGETGRGHSPNFLGIFLGTVGEMIHFNLVFYLLLIVLNLSCILSFSIMGKLFHLMGKLFFWANDPFYYHFLLVLNFGNVSVLYLSLVQFLEMFL